MTSTASPTASRIEATRALSESVRDGSQQYPMAPSRTMQQWLGMTLTFLASGTYEFILSRVSPATMLISSFPDRSSPSANTSGTCFGFTARTTIPASEHTSFAVSSTRMPWAEATLSLVAALGAHATMPSLSKTPLATRPPIRASAIFPAPMKPISADMLSDNRFRLNKGWGSLSPVRLFYIYARCGTFMY